MIDRMRLSIAGPSLAYSHKSEGPKFVDRIKNSCPLVRKVALKSTKGYDHNLVVIEFALAGERLFSLTAIETEHGDFRIRTIDVSPAKVLWGHNGCLICTQKLLVIAMARLDTIVQPLLAPGSSLFRVHGAARRWNITSVEFAVQFGGQIEA